jgi:C4-dicarboxylate-specific signal transduction histidine kinase
VLINLVRNAMQAIGRSGGPGKVVVRLATDGTDRVLEVEDSGPVLRRRVFRSDRP